MTDFYGRLLERFSTTVSKKRTAHWSNSWHFCPTLSRFGIWKICNRFDQCALSLERRLTNDAQWEFWHFFPHWLKVWSSITSHCGQIRLVKKELENPMRCGIGRRPKATMESKGNGKMMKGKKSTRKLTETNSYGFFSWFLTTHTCIWPIIDPLVARCQKPQAPINHNKIENNFRDESGIYSCFWNDLLFPAFCSLLVAPFLVSHFSNFAHCPKELVFDLICLPFVA